MYLLFMMSVFNNFPVFHWSLRRNQCCAVHTRGYLRKYSMFNLLRRFFIGKEFIGDDEGRWLRINQHYLNGPAFGGLIGTAHGFGRFLQDQLRPESVLFSPETKRQFEMQQTDGAGRAIAMTLGWHIRASRGQVIFSKRVAEAGFTARCASIPKLVSPRLSWPIARRFVLAIS